MGKPGWEDETWNPGRSSRGNRADNPDAAERYSGRPNERERAGRGTPDPRGYDRFERQSSQYTDDSGWERPRSPKRDDELRGSSSGRSGAAGGASRRASDGRGFSTDSDRSGHSRAPGRNDYRGDGGARDPRRSTYDSRDERMDERSTRGPRPPVRGASDVWSPARGASAARNRVPGAETYTGARLNRPRPGPNAAADMSGYGTGGRPGLEELRARRLRQQGNEASLSEETGGFSAGKAFLVIVFMLLLGSGGAYAYFKLTTPVVHSNSGVPISSPGSSSSSFVPYLAVPETQTSANVIVFRSPRA